MKEREAKLTVPPGFDLPELGGPDDAFQAEPQAARRLQTTYYDTADLRLARWGASLRYRPGEAGRSSCPRASGSLLVRAEHVFPGDGRKPPAEAVALVRAFTRTAPLEPSARMRTLRQPVELRDPAGARLAELVDDEVQVLDGRRGGQPLPRARGRAGRVGRHGPARPGGGPAAGGRRPGRRADRQVPARPQRARARARGPRSRSRRSTATPPSTPCSATTWPAAPCGCSATRRGCGPARTRSGAPGRVATRRVRSTLRTFSKLLDEEWTDRLRDDLKWLANLLGEVRDTDVLLERFSEHLSALPAADAKAGPRLLAKLEEQRDQARRRLLGGMASRSTPCCSTTWSPPQPRRPCSPGPTARPPRSCRRWSPGPGRSCARGPQGRRRPARRAAPPDPHPGQAGPLRRRGGRAGDRQAGRDVRRRHRRPPERPRRPPGRGRRRGLAAEGRRGRPARRRPGRRPAGRRRAGQRRRHPRPLAQGLEGRHRKQLRAWLP